MKPQNLIHIFMALLCFGLLPKAQAVTPPPPGAYPNFTTAAGEGALSSLTTGIDNTAVGWFALGFNQIGNFNVAVGGGALDLNTADNNTAVGASALLLNTTGTNNTAIGVDALVFNNTGSDNTAVGKFALFNNTTGESNVAIGDGALEDNTTGNFHTAIGSGALQNCIAPPDFAGNTAIGAGALNRDTTGNFNIAIGDSALFSNTIGGVNIAIGLDALISNTIGAQNVAIGANSLFFNTEGNGNTAYGVFTLFANTTGVNNTAVGINALQGVTTGSSNIALGVNSGTVLTTGNGNIYIGNQGFDPAESDSIHIGLGHLKTFIAGISGVTVAGGVGVIVDANGQLGTVVSSARFKDSIRPMDKASEAILALKPVTFRYKHELDPEGIAQFGLVAEDVEKVNPDLVARDGQGKPYTVRYEAVNAMLLNEFLKEHHQVQDLKTIVAGQQRQIEALTAGLQKVSTQLEASKPAPQVVNNP